MQVGRDGDTGGRVLQQTHLAALVQSSRMVTPITRQFHFSASLMHLRGSQGVLNRQLESRIWNTLVFESSSVNEV